MRDAWFCDNILPVAIFLDYIVNCNQIYYMNMLLKNKLDLFVNLLSTFCKPIY